MQMQDIIGTAETSLNEEQNELLREKISERPWIRALKNNYGGEDFKQNIIEYMREEHRINFDSEAATPKFEPALALLGKKGFSLGGFIFESQKNNSIRVSNKSRGFLLQLDLEAEIQSSEKYNIDAARLKRIALDYYIGPLYKPKDKKDKVWGGFEPPGQQNIGYYKRLDTDILVLSFELELFLSHMYRGTATKLSNIPVTLNYIICSDGLSHQSYCAVLEPDEETHIDSNQESVIDFHTSMGRALMYVILAKGIIKGNKKAAEIVKDASIPILKTNIWSMKEESSKWPINVVTL
jgi:hypothetical protein